jgi:hypothetical protein
MSTPTGGHEKLVKAYKLWVCFEVERGKEQSILEGHDYASSKPIRQTHSKKAKSLRWEWNSGPFGVGSC